MEQKMMSSVRYDSQGEISKITKTGIKLSPCKNISLAVGALSIELYNLILFQTLTFTILNRLHILAEYMLFIILIIFTCVEAEASISVLGNEGHVYLLTQ